MRKQEFEIKLLEMISECSLRQGERQAARFTEIMKEARKHGLEDITKAEMVSFCEKEGLPPMWELPSKFEGIKPLPPFPIECLPELLRDYLKAVCEYVQVKPEMAVLPLLSVLSLCVQGKAVIQYPANNHTEPLNLYTLTVAPPGERKTAVLNEFIRPVYEYQKRYNKAHRAEIEAQRAKKELLQQRRAKAISQGSENETVLAAKELSKLEDKSEMCLTVKDVTPEGLAQVLAAHNERMGVVDCEGTVFDVLSGIYSKGVSNIGLILEAYDGSPYSVSRAGKESVSLNAPLLTMCLMTQPEHYLQAIRNKQFFGRGFVHRFMFAFPESMAGYQDFSSMNIPESLSRRYDELIERLLVIPYADIFPILQCDTGASYIFRDYHDHIQLSMRTGGELESIKEWSSKQFARAMRIAGILHLCQHKEKGSSVKVSAETARAAVAIAKWSEAQALRALSGEGGESPTVRAAKLILDKLRKLGKPEVTRSELTSSLRALQGSEFDEPLELLESMRCVEIETIPGTKGRARQLIRINPYYL